MLFDPCDRTPNEARDGVDGREPRRTLRSAAQTRAEALPLGAGGAREEAQVLASRGARRTNWTAVDAGRDDGGEEPPVEAPVSGAQRAITNVGVDRHGRQSSQMRGRLLAIFGPRYCGIGHSSH